MKLKRNFDEPIRDLDGQPVRVGQTMEALLTAINSIWPRIPSDLQAEFNAALKAQNVDDAELTLRIACVRSLVGAYPDEQNVAAEEAVSRVELARKINTGGVVEITDAERDKMKKLIYKRFSGVVIPVVAGELLEQDVPLGTR